MIRCKHFIVKLNIVDDAIFRVIQSIKLIKSQRVWEFFPIQNRK